MSDKSVALDNVQWMLVISALAECMSRGNMETHDAMLTVSEKILDQFTERELQGTLNTALQSLLNLEKAQQKQAN